MVKMSGVTYLYITIVTLLDNKYAPKLKKEHIYFLVGGIENDYTVLLFNKSIDCTCHTIVIIGCSDKFG